jgi:hypothetical protein
MIHEYEINNVKLRTGDILCTHDGGAPILAGDRSHVAKVVWAVWGILPPLLLLTTETVEGAMRYLDSAAVANTLPMGALTYYFSKSGKTTKGA